MHHYYLLCRANGARRHALQGALAVVVVLEPEASNSEGPRMPTAHADPPPGEATDPYILLNRVVREV